jgi:hypothetical protein
MSLVPAIGSIGWATLKTVRDPPPADEALPPVAQPASAATAAAPLVDNTFLRSMMSVSPVVVDEAPRRRATLAPMLSRAWFFAYFAFSHRSAVGEAGA